jgi:hypothetical protein
VTNPSDAARRGIEPVRWYGTRFSVDEDPLSEGGLWICGGTAGVDWTDIAVSGGVAYGAVTRLGAAGHHAGQGHVVPAAGRTQVPAGDFDDPTAVLAGAWGRNQCVTAAVFSRNPTEEYRQEIEIRLRSSLSPHWCTGYEVLWRCLKTESAYAEIVRWNGKPGDFTVLRRLVGEHVGVGDGDVVEASVSGDTLRGFINGVEVIAATDDTYRQGSPGIGFNSGVGTTNVDHGIIRFEVNSYGE